MTAAADGRPVASVVIPAHDEGPVLRASLDRLLDGAEPGEFDVVVVCNGCTDDTPVIAASYGPPVRAVEIDRADKIAALNAGDAATDVFPRVYLDADVEVGVDDVRRVLAALEGPVLVAAPARRLDLTGVGPAARAYHRVWERLPSITGTLVGSGFYALSARGRARFGDFPDVIGDDFFISAMFDADERATVADASVRVRPPRTARQLVRRRARIVQGNAEVRAQLPPTRRADRRTGDPLRVGYRNPRLWPAVAVYLAIAVAGEGLARWRMRTGRRSWAGEQRS